MQSFEFGNARTHSWQALPCHSRDKQNSHKQLSLLSSTYRCPLSTLPIVYSPGSCFLELVVELQASGSAGRQLCLFAWQSELGFLKFPQDVKR